MTGFSPAWLDLREPVDHRSVNAFVRRELMRHLRGRQQITVADLGCGTGSNLRALAGDLGARQHWMLIDHDAHLLAAAGVKLRELGGVSRDADDELAIDLEGNSVSVTFRQADLSHGDLGLIVGDADLVTAAALFDLVSQPVIARLAATVAARGPAFYTVLTYDGIAAWLPEHAADAGMRAGFNQHQRRDKGFGPAEGPVATDALAAAFEQHGYRVVRGKSPWVLDDRASALRREVDRGWAAAVLETGIVPAAAVDEWLEHRLSAETAVTIVGHEDLLALPPPS